MANVKKAVDSVEGMNYRALISRDEKEVAAGQVENRVRAASIQTDRDILSGYESLSSITTALNNAYAAFPFQPTRIVDLEREQEEVKDDIAKLEALKARMF